MGDVSSESRLWFGLETVMRGDLRRPSVVGLSRIVVIDEESSGVRFRRESGLGSIG